MTADLAEQPPDWTTPGAHLVVPGVHRIPVPLPMQGLRAVNVYVIDDPEGPVLVDSGLAGPETGQALKEALSPLGHRLRDVQEILVTHAHWDHWTEALVLRALFGTRMRLGRGEEPVLKTIDVKGPVYEGNIEALRRNGAPDLADIVATWIHDERIALVPFGPPDTWMATGDQVRLLERRLDIYETPGHTAGHVVLRDAAAGILFAGDHVLPHITPSIGLERFPTGLSLQNYLRSLELVRDLPDTLLLPAHGPVTHSVHTRVDELLAHHEERLSIVHKAVLAGCATARDVAAAMKWTRHERTFSELKPFDQMLAVLEVAAHLEVLAEGGIVRRSDEDGVRHYA